MHITYIGNTIEFSTEEGGSIGGSMTGKVGEQGERMLISGSLVSKGEGSSVVAAWTVTR